MFTEQSVTPKFVMVRLIGPKGWGAADARLWLSTLGGVALVDKAKMSSTATGAEFPVHVAVHTGPRPDGTVADTETLRLSVGGQFAQGPGGVPLGVSVTVFCVAGALPPTSEVKIVIEPPPA